MLDDLVTQGDFGPKRACTKRIRALEAAWARLQSEVPGWPEDPLDQQFQAALTSWLRFHNAMLIGEVVPEALRFLRNNPASEIRSAFDHIIVDEYQDLNKAEQELIELLATHSSTAIVGDADQSIYGFRHANPEGIEAFQTQHPQTHDETLDECRRCPIGVVSIADHLIQYNHPGASVPRLRPKPGNPAGEVHIIQWGTIPEEAQGLAQFVRTLVKVREYSPGDILILTPRRLLGYGIRDCVRGTGIPVHSFYHEEALEGEAAQRAYSLLSLLVNGDDRVSLRWWLGQGTSAGRITTAYRLLRQYCEAAGMSPRTALEELDQGRIAVAGVSVLLPKYRELRTILEDLANKSLPELVDELLPDGNDECSVLRETTTLATPHLSNVGELLDVIQTHVSQPEMPEEGNYVRVMSLHKSKGLTSKVTIVTDCTQGLIPVIDTDRTPVEQAALLAEQRRLFYVAITRCTELLVLSSAVTMQRKLAHRIAAQLRPGRSLVGTTIASQFLDELGPSAPTPLSGHHWWTSGFPA